MSVVRFFFRVAAWTGIGLALVFGAVIRGILLSGRR